MRSTKNPYLNPKPGAKISEIIKTTTNNPMQSQLLYITVIQANLEKYEARVYQEGTVSAKLNEYLNRRKQEIEEMKDRLLTKSEKTEA